MKVLPFVLFCLCVVIGKAQDLIVYKDGNRVSCRIERIDSANIHCRMGGRLVIEVPRSSVQNYYLSKKTQDRLNKAAAAAKAGYPGTVSSYVPLDREGLFIFGIGAAVSNPVGDFADQDIYSETAGLALTGFALNGGIIFKASDVFGIKLAFRSQRQKVETTGICMGLKAGNPGFNFSCVAEPWRLNGLFAGITLRFPLKSVEGLRLNLDFDAGLPRCNLAAISATGTSATGYGVLTQNAETVSTPAWALGGGLSYRIAEEVALNVFVEYVQAKPTFAINYYFNGVQVDYASYQQKMGVLNIGIGICLVPARK